MVRETYADPLGGHPVRRASTVCLVRDASGGLEVLMVQRPHTARFMPSAWVFPGGAVDPDDADPPAEFGSEVSDWRVAALRELIEETGIWLTEDGVREGDLTERAFEVIRRKGMALDPGSLVYFSNWVTPEVFPIRFDTRFYLAMVPTDTNARVDGHELVDHAWVRPLDALDRESAGAWDVAFPTRETLKLLTSERNTSSLMERVAAMGPIPSIEPRLFVSETEARILLPGEPGFAEAGPMQHDPTILQRLAEVVQAGASVPAEFKARS